MSIIKSTLTLTLITFLCSSSLAEDIRSFTFGDYTVVKSVSGSFGDNSYNSKMEVSLGGKVIYSKINPTGLETVEFYPELARVEGDCLDFVYAEAGDGLDDDYLHYVRICGETVSDFKCRIDKQSGEPDLVLGEIPESFNKVQTEQALKKAFERLYSDRGNPDAEQ